ncbi:MAG: DivIVA domain-containing protein [Oscillatoria sp. PMC 1050.18]|nr:DivIVA domain-containing protein [Oscillatoria sp. PMC 1050.18]
MQPEPPSQSGGTGFDIQRELDRIEEIILYSTRIYFTGRTLVDEEKLLDQLDYVRLNLPGAFKEALDIIAQKEEILLQAEEYAQEIVDAAEQRALEILDETRIIQQAELEASRIREVVRQECEEMQRKNFSEIEQMRLQARQELEQLRQLTLAECEDIQDGADEYADAVLQNIEKQLSDLLRVIRNGRQQLNNDTQTRGRQGGIGGQGRGGTRRTRRTGKNGRINC